MERIHANLTWSMQVVPRFRVQGRHVAGGAFAFAFEHDFPTRCGGLVVTSRWRPRRRDCQLVKMKRRQLRGKLVGFATRVVGADFDGDRIRAFVIEASIIERARRTRRGRVFQILILSVHALTRRSFRFLRILVFAGGPILLFLRTRRREAPIRSIEWKP